MHRAATAVAFALAALPLAASAAEITLSFGEAPGGTANGFRIERREEATRRFEPLALVGSGVPDFVDRGLPAGVTYCYRVRALGAAGGSAWSPEVCAVAEEEPAVAEGPAPGTEAGEVAGGPAPGTEAGTAEEALAAPGAAPSPPAEARRIRASGGWLQVLD